MIKPAIPGEQTILLHDPLFSCDQLSDKGRKVDSTSASLRLGQPEVIPGDIFAFLHSRERDRFDTAFEIVPGVIIPVGDYGWDRYVVQYISTRARPVSVDLKVRQLGFYGGSRRDYLGSLEWRASAQFFTSVSWQLQQAHLPQGNFAVRLGSAKVVYTYSPDLQISLFGQYDNLSNSLGVNFRVKWIVTPGDDVYFVVNQGYDTTDDRMRPLQNDTSLKGAWTIRF